MENFKKRVVELQNELKAPKGNYNSFGKYKYRSCEDILEAVKPLLKKYSLLLTVSDEVVAVGNRIYIKASAILQDLDSVECIVNTAFAREEEEKKGMDGSQISGTASSYARKYCLNGLLLIDDTKDADTDEFAKQTEKTDYKCDGCNNVINDTKKRNGETWFASEMYEYSKLRYGKHLCAECMKKAEKEKKE